MKKIILASSSLRRKNLLEQIGLEFEIDPSNYQEDMNLKMNPRKLAEYLSLRKAQDVALRHKDSIIIAADTFCVLGKEVLGKPKTKENAKIMLQKLSGKAHSVITGFTIIDTETGKKFSKSIETKVYFKDVPEQEIDAYIATGEPLEFAGSYAIQHLGGLFVEKIEGDYFNIVGLPILPLTVELKKFGINVF
ncbi:MAG: septum formation protein Maf [Candidatus Staskawiczbacteria bacterium RIFCSPLOWO2_01_FULL_38_12b]|uniref:dTTP/UTP pyrophosphatase n=1 Tax=Candidatus Staskawiczbacteria bacterium RIFCSPLOWO2_01_FULL_38_12b TaxID=1802214 RepID=A0A1G2IEH5_9BACT|nr:MAG: septum formation protein Maf [Candidatus Staskawiczbacteria bacterium RIFCSPLOWO2_01_FULL_38_12b]